MDVKTLSTSKLELAAINAHRRGDRWTEFWEQHGDDVRKAERYDAGRFHRLVRQLLAIVASGDDANTESLDDDMPRWEADDDTPADVGTKARCLLPLLAIPGVMTADRLAQW